LLSFDPVEVLDQCLLALSDDRTFGILDYLEGAPSKVICFHVKVRSLALGQHLRFLVGNPESGPYGAAYLWVV